MQGALLFAVNTLASSYLTDHLFASPGEKRACTMHLHAANQIDSSFLIDLIDPLDESNEWRGECDTRRIAIEGRAIPSLGDFLFCTDQCLIIDNY